MNKCPICLNDFLFIESMNQDVINESDYMLYDEPIIIKKKHWKLFKNCNHGVCRNCWKDMKIVKMNTCPLCRTKLSEKMNNFECKIIICNSEKCIDGFFVILCFVVLIGLILFNPKF